MAQSEYDIWFLFPVKYCVLIRRQQQQLKTCYDCFRSIFDLVRQGTEFLPYRLPAYNVFSFEWLLNCSFFHLRCTKVCAGKQGAYIICFYNRDNITLIIFYVTSINTPIASNRKEHNKVTTISGKSFTACGKYPKLNFLKRLNVFPIIWY